jgi:hypothetical protein
MRPRFVWLRGEPGRDAGTTIEQGKELPRLALSRAGRRDSLPENPAGSM